jgi:hypothetical protein
MECTRQVNVGQNLVQQKTVMRLDASDQRLPQVRQFRSEPPAGQVS